MGLLSRSMETRKRFTAAEMRIEDTIFALRRVLDEGTLKKIEVSIPVETVKELKQRGLW